MKTWGAWRKLITGKGVIYWREVEEDGKDKLEFRATYTLYPSEEAEIWGRIMARKGRKWNG